jgi:hypothetical protein
MGLMLSQQPEADALLDRDPLALVIGMVLDQQMFERRIRTCMPMRYDERTGATWTA